MSVIGDVLATLPEGSVQEVRIGAFWTGVVTEVGGQRRCGLATAMRGDDDHHHGGGAAVPDTVRWGWLHWPDRRVSSTRPWAWPP